ncbi:hypothetical protein ANN_06135, partial [Periplaneta americana]
GRQARQYQCVFVFGKKMWPLLFLWNTELFSVFLSTLTAILIFVVTINIIKYMTSDLHIPIRDTSKQHNWRHAKLLSKPCYCSVCEALMVTGEGAYCDCCGVCADRGCIKTADRKIKCKAITSCEKGPARHHWVKGIYFLLTVILLGGCDCGQQYLRRFHLAHRFISLKVCDFGPYRSHLIPPSCVVLTKKRSTVRRKLQLRAVKSPGWKDWTPLIVMANRKSGNNDGAIILSLFRRLLNPAQVVDLAEHPPETALEWCCLLGEVRATVLVAGGDGTIGWVLNAVDKLQLKVLYMKILVYETPVKTQQDLVARIQVAAGVIQDMPEIFPRVRHDITRQCTKCIEPSPGVAILPIGTGNDLSRVLGWGKEHHPNFDPGTFLEQVQKARLVELDRWNVQVHPYRHLGIRLPVRNMNMYNYLSVGVDAQVTLDFHRTRESPFYIISSRLINKVRFFS